MAADRVLGLLPASLAASQIAGLATDETQDDADARKPLAVGDSGMVLSYGRCCLPIPGDDIVGFMSVGRGIVIHRAECRNLAEFRNHPSRWVPVDWKNRSGDQFLTEIQVRTMDRVGVLAEVSGTISSQQSNIEYVQVNTEFGTICWPNGADLDPDVVYSEITGVPLPSYSLPKPA